ncbi:MAG: TIGR02757 family protein [Deltaproteobacteria bacterium]|nr:TIGR02757 family protein [Deltaproteobacteria bacterium]
MRPQRRPLINRGELEEIRSIYHHRCFVDPDPLLFLYEYDHIRDREIAGMVASSLAYGRVAQIMRSVSAILGPMGKSPFEFLMNSTPAGLGETYKAFRHRFTTGEEMASMLYGVKLVLERYGSLQECFLEGLKEIDDHTVLHALSRFVMKIKEAGRLSRNSLLPSPDKGSACKRLNLFMRWMVRKDQVDPGGWDRVPASMLIIPLDTHMYRIGRRLGLTSRKQAGMLAALEITDAFRRICPEDPVRYDFALTRLGIRKEIQGESVLERLGDAPIEVAQGRDPRAEGR